jgi:hypothetical protein
MLHHLQIIAEVGKLTTVELLNTAADFQMKALCDMTKSGFAAYPPLKRLSMLLSWYRALPVLDKCPQYSKSQMLSRALPAFLAALDPDGLLIEAFHVIRMDE